MIELRLEQITPADTEHYTIVKQPSGEQVGTIRLQLSDSDDIRLYTGNVGYRVAEAYRGR